ncbi:hypothetical protein VTP01DRAFT_9516 [Rhizomucor pusillus]|uniref:uncharacterized protein n=1 Tax=Rhizomucor pusillus TaxID=4840 RepID=UPI00374389E2
MKELVEQRFGGSVERFTRTVPLLDVVRDEYSEQLLQGIQNLSQFMQNVVIRVMLFVDIYIVQNAHSSIPTYVFSQQFFYSMAQLVLGQTQYPALIYPVNNFKYYAQTFASACNVIKDAYTKIIVEYFQSRVEKYTILELQKFVPVSILRPSSEILAGGDPVMPRYLLPCSIEIGNAIQEIWMELMPYMPRPCTTKEMAAKPGNFIPALHYILQQYHDEHQQTPHIQEKSNTRALPSLFSLVPLPSRNWRFIDINAETLAGLLKMPVPRTYNQRLTVFQTVFNLDKYRFFKDEGCMFTNQITTNGYQTPFHFARSKKEREIELELDDFSINEISSYYHPCTLVPGRRDVFNASYGCGSEVHEVRKCSTAEYYGMTGSKRRNQMLSKEKRRLGIEYIESNFPTGKISKAEMFLHYVSYYLWHLETLLDFYNYEQIAATRFRNYQGIQLPSQPISAIRSTLDMEREQPPAKEKKWRKARVNCDNNVKMPLIVFRSGMFGKDGVPLKGHQSGAVGILWRELKKREANGEVAVVKIDEYLTSQVQSNWQISWVKLLRE